MDFERSICRVGGKQTPQGIGGGGADTHSWDVARGQAVASCVSCGWPGERPSKGRMDPNSPPPKSVTWDDSFFLHMRSFKENMRPIFPPPKKMTLYLVVAEARASHIYRGA